MISPRAVQSLLKRCARSYSATNANVKTQPASARFAMNKPDLYGSSNDIQKKCTIKFLKEFEHKIKWHKNGDTAIDLGCGDGSVTVAVKNYCPSDFKKFIASDKNDKMVEYASQRYTNENMVFTVLDIAQNIPKDLIGTFNHVFSFYALHWVKDQQKGFNNIHKLLTDDGDCFLTFLASTAIYDVYNVLSQHPKWKTWLRDVDLFVSPYYKMQKPEKKVEEIMKKSGFKNVEVQCNRMTSIQDSLQDLKNIVQAVEPFNMPDEVFDEFFEYYKAAGQETGVLYIDRNSNDEVVSVKYDYSLLVCFGQK